MKAATRSALGVLLLLTYVAVSDARWIYRAGRGVLDAGKADSITSYERRYRELKQALPRPGVIGYVSGAEAVRDRGVPAVSADGICPGPAGA